MPEFPQSSVQSTADLRVRATYTAINKHVLDQQLKQQFPKNKSRQKKQIRTNKNIYRQIYDE